MPATTAGMTVAAARGKRFSCAHQRRGRRGRGCREVATKTSWSNSCRGHLPRPGNYPKQSAPERSGQACVCRPVCRVLVISLPGLDFRSAACDAGGHFPLFLRTHPASADPLNATLPDPCARGAAGVSSSVRHVGASRVRVQSASAPSVIRVRSLDGSHNSCNRRSAPHSTGPTFRIDRCGCLPASLKQALADVQSDGLARSRSFQRTGREPEHQRNGS